jgi:hypothetical protein
VKIAPEIGHPVPESASYSPTPNEIPPTKRNDLARKICLRHIRISGRLSQGVTLPVIDFQNIAWHDRDEAENN